MSTLPSPKRRGPPATKQIDILWTAARLFAARGVAHTSTREIAAQANTTERTLFKHYASKEGLVRAVIAQAVLPQLAPSSLDALRGAIESGKRGGAASFANWHRTLLKVRAEATAQAPELTRLLCVELLRDETVRASFAAQWHATAWQPLVKLFTQLQVNAQVRSDITPERLARLFLSVNLGYLIGRFVLAPELSWDEEADLHAASEVFLRGCRPN